MNYISCFFPWFMLALVNVAYVSGAAIIACIVVRHSRTANSTGSLVVMSVFATFWFFAGFWGYAAFCHSAFPWASLTRLLCAPWRYRGGGGSSRNSSTAALPQFVVRHGMEVLPREPPVQTPGARVDTGDEIPVYERRGCLRQGGATECAVCLGEVKDGEMVKQMPACLHLFHGECIDRWLGERATCPVCRCSVLAQLAPQVV